ncbi:hypothetical protein BDV96DRAFT_156561 [Lophiotrema nucula]|uniref:Fungal N-terminal domain-containing protein n=1 Tax=Lophiotrema nucula TaxID=690887 RepID=A0A6A5Z101_9PLEO|nr:hypothetical protein BDV96DRAFT_156561 [Lophiotrema nucula]
MDPVSVFGIVSGSATLLELLLKGFLGLKTAVREIRSVDEASEGFLGELDVFHFVLKDLESAFKDTAFLQNIQRWWDPSQLEELLDNALKTQSQLYTVVRNITRQRSVLKDVRTFYRTKQYDKEIAHLRIRVGTYINALQIPLTLGRIGSLLVHAGPISSSQPMPDYLQRNADNFANAILCEKVAKLEESIQTLSLDIKHFSRPQDQTWVASVQQESRELMTIAGSLASTASNSGSLSSTGRTDTSGAETARLGRNVGARQYATSVDGAPMSEQGHRRIKQWITSINSTMSVNDISESMARIKVQKECPSGGGDKIAVHDLTIPDGYDWGRLAYRGECLGVSPEGFFSCCTSHVETAGILALSQDLEYILASVHHAQQRVEDNALYAVGHLATGKMHILESKNPQLYNHFYPSVDFCAPKNFEGTRSLLLPGGTELFSWRRAGPAEDFARDLPQMPGIFSTKSKSWIKKGPSIFEGSRYLVQTTGNEQYTYVLIMCDGANGAPLWERTIAVPGLSAYCQKQKVEILGNYHFKAVFSTSCRHVITCTAFPCRIGPTCVYCIQVLEVLSGDCIFSHLYSDSSNCSATQITPDDHILLLRHFGQSYVQVYHLSTGASSRKIPITTSNYTDLASTYADMWAISPDGASFAILEPGALQISVYHISTGNRRTFAFDDGLKCCLLSWTEKYGLMGAGWPKDAFRSMRFYSVLDLNAAGNTLRFSTIPDADVDAITGDPPAQASTTAKISQ